MSRRAPLLTWVAWLTFGSPLVAQETKPIIKPPPPVPGRAPATTTPATEEPTSTTAPATSVSEVPRRVIKTDAEWARLLSRDQFMVTRRKATEPAFTGKLLHNKAKGTYTCVCCNAPLFTSRTKFDSGTGWPSFYAPVSPRSVTNEVDLSYGQQRIEVVCSTCGAHLGHVFDDGPPPTGLRYCMNSLSLGFVKDDPSGSAAKDRNKTANRPAASAPAMPSAEKNEGEKPDVPSRR